MTVPFEIDVETLADLMAEGGTVGGLSVTPESILVLDVREAWERAICALPDSLHIPLMSLPQRVSELPKDATIVALCHHGVRSAQATVWLRNQGFDRTINVGGGIDAWAIRIDPNMKVY